MPTGEVRLGEDAQPEPEADLELMLRPEADPEQELAPWPFLEKEAEDAQPEAPAKKPEEKSAPQTAEPPAAVKPETPRQTVFLLVRRGVPGFLSLFTFSCFFYFFLSMALARGTAHYNLPRNENPLFRRFRVLLPP